MNMLAKDIKTIEIEVSSSLEQLHVKVNEFLEDNKNVNIISIDYLSNHKLSCSGVYNNAYSLENYKSAFITYLK